MALTLSDLRPLEMILCGEHESARPVIERLQRLYYADQQPIYSPTPTPTPIRPASGDGPAIIAEFLAAHRTAMLNAYGPHYLTRTQTSREIGYAENRGRALAGKIADDLHTNRPAGKLGQFVDDEADDPSITLARNRRGQIRSYEHLDAILKTGPDPIDLPADIRTQLLAERAGWLTTDQTAALRRLPTTAPTTRPPGRPQIHTPPPTPPSRHR